jgi:amidase
MLVGSSSGAAVSISANIVPLSFGTETDSSIVGPASINGIVGIKPTVGLTSRSGVIPISENLDTVGSFGRTVADAVHGLNMIVGADSRDPHTLATHRHQEENYLAFLSSKKALKGAKFGLSWYRCWELVPEDLKRVGSRIFDAIAEAGGEVIRVNFPCAEERIGSDGRWNWYISPFSQLIPLLTKPGNMVNHRTRSSQL